jgi:hypothetical protein
MTDSSGGVLAGVTVEAASPALIEEVRSVVTFILANFNALKAGSSSPGAPATLQN